MGFLSGMVGTVVKTALTPIAIVKDVVDVATDGDADNTKNLLDSAKNDAVDACDDLTEGNL